MSCRRTSLAAAAILASLHPADAFVLSVARGATQCFDEHANASDHISGQWSITGGFSSPSVLKGWKVVVTSPAGDLVYSVDGERSGSFDYMYYATYDGGETRYLLRARHL